MAGILVPATSTAAEAPSPPVTVEQRFVGTSEEADHAIAVTVTFAPTKETGPINNTVVRLRASEAAFIAQSSVSTSETAGGEQVITRRETSAPNFDIGELQPSETASISFRVYPKAVLPSGERLATVAVETQFEATQRVVSDQKVIASTVNVSQASYAVDSGLSPATSAGAGAGGATLLTISAAALYRRRRRKTLRGLLRSAREQSTSMGTKQAIDTALKRLGGSNSGSETAVEPDTTDNSDDTLSLDFDD
ncbi:hypothetical protein [Halorubrum ezzemoulense]|uniref:hypothetical protein n=1 Tax=Halorubrum ezzemoulense TaxID=337243 RepID=UPI00232E088E|nr:hypothetical protein [Halorubrum ezzemoulense]